MGKRVKELLEAVTALLESGEKIKAVIVGEKLYRSLLKEKEGLICFTNKEVEIPVFVDTDFKPYQYEIEVGTDAEEKDKD